MDALIVVGRVFNRWDLELLDKIAENRREYRDLTSQLTSLFGPESASIEDNGHTFIVVPDTRSALTEGQGSQWVALSDRRIDQLQEDHLELSDDRQELYLRFCLLIRSVSAELAAVFVIDPDSQPEVE